MDVASGDAILGYDLQEVLDGIFAGTAGHEAMCREYRAFLLVAVEKSSNRRGSELFRRYVNALVTSPKDWFRLRDCDALARFSMAGALACSDFDDIWFSEEEWQILAELGDGLYDAVAYYKHRAEGETNSTFAYAGGGAREDAFRKYREVLWALDVAWAHSPARVCVVNFLRYFGGPIHMMMRRYRFIEDGLMVGRPETDKVVAQTRRNFKLWNRVDTLEEKLVEAQRYVDAVSKSERLMFPGMVDLLEQSLDGRCSQCRYRDSLRRRGGGAVWRSRHL